LSLSKVKNIVALFLGCQVYRDIKHLRKESNKQR
jgi:hypothetical protein